MLKDQMLKNHGYYKVKKDGVDTCLISCDEGVFRFTPPEGPEGDWKIEELVSEAASDAVLVDLDGDGKEELALISPFHGEHIYIYRETEEGYQKVYSYDTAEFAHAIYGGSLLGRPAVIIGHRQGERNLLLFTWDQDKGDFRADVLDRDCGPANVLKYLRDGEEVLISTNREIDEVAMYTFEEE